mmetsp:Transcript_8428/g.18109  ORF Transcript_8428/g.18109 Transcript_8428/m.18109 type:complete len:259 (+) Transcript_8428:886-1662(+)
MRKLAKHVDNSWLRVRYVQQADGERYNPAKVHFSILQHVLKRSSGHLSSDLLAHADERDTQRCDCLVRIVLFQMFGTNSKHFLDFHNISACSICAGLHCEETILADLARNSFQSLHHNIRRFLQIQIQETQSEARKSCHTVLNHLCISLEHSRIYCLGYVRLAGSNKNKAKSKGSEREEFNWSPRVRNNWGEKLQDIFPLSSGISKPQSKGRTNTHDHRLIRVKFLRQKSQSWVALAADIRTDDSHRESSSRADEVVV